MHGNDVFDPGTNLMGRRLLLPIVPHHPMKAEPAVLKTSQMFKMDYVGAVTMRSKQTLTEGCT